jgi:hypothetical protein
MLFYVTQLAIPQKTTGIEKMENVNCVVGFLLKKALKNFIFYQQK